MFGDLNIFRFIPVTIRNLTSHLTGPSVEILSFFLVRLSEWILILSLNHFFLSSVHPSS